MITSWDPWNACLQQSAGTQHDTLSFTVPWRGVDTVMARRKVGLLAWSGLVTTAQDWHPWQAFVSCCGYPCEISWPAGTNEGRQELRWTSSRFMFPFFFLSIILLLLAMQLILSHLSAVLAHISAITCWQLSAEQTGSLNKCKRRIWETRAACKIGKVEFPVYPLTDQSYHVLWNVSVWKIALERVKHAFIQVLNMLISTILRKAKAHVYTHIWSKSRVIHLTVCIPLTKVYSKKFNVGIFFTLHFHDWHKILSINPQKEDQSY